MAFAHSLLLPVRHRVQEHEERLRAVEAAVGLGAHASEPARAIPAKHHASSDASLWCAMVLALAIATASLVDDGALLGVPLPTGPAFAAPWAALLVARLLTGQRAVAATTRAGGVLLVVQAYVLLSSHVPSFALGAPASSPPMHASPWLRWPPLAPRSLAMRV